MTRRAATARERQAREKKRERYERVEGYVWCDKHGTVHDDELDPYEMGGEDVCRRADHQPIYRRAILAGAGQ